MFYNFKFLLIFLFMFAIIQCEPKSHIKNPYKILGLSTQSTKQQIKQRFIELSKSLHPDKINKQGLSSRQIDQKQKAYSQILSAYQLIKNNDFDVNRILQNTNTNFGQQKPQNFAYYYGMDPQLIQMRMNFQNFYSSKPRNRQYRSSQNKQSETPSLSGFFKGFLEWIERNRIIPVGAFLISFGIFMFLCLSKKEQQTIKQNTPYDDKKTQISTQTPIKYTPKFNRYQDDEQYPQLRRNTC